MLTILQTVVWGIAVTLIGLASAIGVNHILPEGRPASRMMTSDTGFSNEPGSVGAWVHAEMAE